MRKASVLLVVILVLLLVVSCGKKPKQAEEPTPPVVTEEKTPTTPPEFPKEEVTKKEITQADLQPIYFDFDRYDLRSGDREILNRNAMVLKDYPTVRIRIEGNCDERGTVEYNLALGEKRARASRDYLVNLGIDPERISIITYGKERASHCQSDACWSQDRKDDFVITSK